MRTAVGHGGQGAGCEGQAFRGGFYTRKVCIDAHAVYLGRVGEQRAQRKCDEGGGKHY